MKFDVTRRIAEVNNFELKEDRDYSWVLDYAKYRVSHSTSNVKIAEEKAGGLLKLVFTVAGAAWLVFLFLTRELNTIPKNALNYWEIAAFITLGCSGVCALAALFPLRRLALFREKVAMNFVNEKDESSKKPLGRFALSLMVCSDYCERVATAKSYWIAAGFALLVVAVALFTMGFSLLCFSQTKPPNSSLRTEAGVPLALEGQNCRQRAGWMPLESQRSFR